MPREPQGQTRPADVIRNAMKIARIANGDGQKVTSGDRKAIAQDAAAARWG